MSKQHLETVQKDRDTQQIELMKANIQIVNLQALAVNPDIEQVLLDEIHKTVSNHDDHVIKAVFYAGVSAYASPINLALKCESGSGKTYSTTQTIKFLPPEDVQMIGSQSPKVISHENGLLLDKNGELIVEPPPKPRKADFQDADEEYRAACDDYYTEQKSYHEKLKDSYYQVDLHNKIFTFLESVNIETFKMIKSTLSHDNETIDHKYVDDHGKVHVTRLVGFPTAIFNSLDNEFISEFATRTLTITPTTTQQKIEASKAISSQKAAYPFLYQQDSIKKQLIQTYLRTVRETVKKLKLKIIVPYPTLHQKFRSLEVRDMRDFNHFLELVPAFTLFKLFQRPIITINEENYVVASIQDVLDAKALFDSVSATTQTATEQRILTFYYECLRTKTNGSTLNVLTDLYNKNHKKVSSKTIQRWLDRLTNIEWVDLREGLQENKHEYTYFPLQATIDDLNQTQLQEGKDIDIEGKDILSMSLELNRFCQMDFDLWLKSEGQTFTVTRHIIISVDGSVKTITVEEFKNFVGRVNPVVCPSLSEAETTPETENMSKARDKQEMSFQPIKMSFDPTKVVGCIALDKSERLMSHTQCPTCGNIRDLIYQLKFFDGSTTDVCSNCGSQALEHLNQPTEEREY